MTRPRRMLLAFCALSMLTVPACKRSSPTSINVLPVSEARDEGGWPVYEVKSDGFALSLPPSWRRIEMDPSAFEDSFREASKGEPALAAMRDRIKGQMGAGVKLVGIDPVSARAGFGANVNVLRLRLPAGASLDAVVGQNLKQLEALSMIEKPVTRERVRGPEGERERIHYRATMKGPTGTDQRLAMTQELAIRGDAYYVVTLTATADQEAKLGADFKKILGSFRLSK